MSQLNAASSTAVLDLRGSRTHDVPSPVLADPSGRRAARLRRAGRAAGMLLVLWMCGLGLTSIGVLPARLVPLAGVVLPALHLTPGDGPADHADHRTAHAAAARFVGPVPVLSAGPAIASPADAPATTRRTASAPGTTDRGRRPSRRPVASSASNTASTPAHATTTTSAPPAAAAPAAPSLPAESSSSSSPERPTTGSPAPGNSGNTPAASTGTAAPGNSGNTPAASTGTAAPGNSGNTPAAAANTTAPGASGETPAASNANAAASPGRSGATPAAERANGKGANSDG